MDEKTLKAVKSIAKDLAKDFVANVKGGKAHFDVAPCLCHVTDAKGTHFRYTTMDRKEVKLPYCSGSEYASMMNAIRDELKRMVERKLKGYVMHPLYEKVSGGGNWWSRSDYDTFVRCVFYKPCKEYKKLEKRLSQLGVDVSHIGWDWRIDYVGGKRSWYNVEESIPCCTSTKKVNEVLEFLKGLKKVEVEIKRYENLEDMERGIKYETEWSGSIEYNLSVKAAKGSLLA